MVSGGDHAATDCLCLFHVSRIIIARIALPLGRCPVSWSRPLWSRSPRQAPGLGASQHKLQQHAQQQPNIATAMFEFVAIMQQEPCEAILHRASVFKLC